MHEMHEYDEKGVKIDLINNVRIVHWLSQQYGLEKSAFVEDVYNMDKELLKTTYSIRGITEEDIILHCEGENRTLISIEGDEDALRKSTKERIAMHLDESLEELGHPGVTRSEEMDAYADKAADIFIRNGGVDVASTGYSGNGQFMYWTKGNPFVHISTMKLVDTYDSSYQRIGISIKEWKGKWLVFVALYD